MKTKKLEQKLEEISEQDFLTAIREGIKEYATLLNQYKGVLSDYEFYKSFEDNQLKYYKVKCSDDSYEFMFTNNKPNKIGFKG